MSSLRGLHGDQSLKEVEGCLLTKHRIFRSAWWFRDVCPNAFQWQGVGLGVEAEGWDLRLREQGVGFLAAEGLRVEAIITSLPGRAPVTWTLGRQEVPVRLLAPSPSKDGSTKAEKRSRELANFHPLHLHAPVWGFGTCIHETAKNNACIL